jgi:hypothetical protein
MERQQIINYRFLSFILGVLLIAGNLFAQPPQRGGMQGPPSFPDSAQIFKMIDELDEAISLSKEQKSKVSELYFSHFEEAKELMEDKKGNRESHREAMDALRQEFDEQVKDLLNENQKTKFEKFIKNQRKQIGENRPR